MLVAPRCGNEESMCLGPRAAGVPNIARCTKVPTVVEFLSETLLSPCSCFTFTLSRPRYGLGYRRRTGGTFTRERISALKLSAFDVWPRVFRQTRSKDAVTAHSWISSSLFLTKRCRPRTVDGPGFFELNAGFFHSRKEGTLVGALGSMIDRHIH
jgi:hypothetical protein